MPLYHCVFENGGSVTGSTIEVTTSDSELYGRTVTLTGGDDTMTGTISNSGSCTFNNVGMLGILTVSATTADDKVATATFEMLYYGQITVPLTFPNVYGVKWEGSSSTAMTRTDDAVGFANPSAAKNNGDGSSPFDDILPWSGMEIIDDATAGKLVKIPKYYYKWTTLDNIMYLQISMTKGVGFNTSPAHVSRGDGKGERDYVYVGRYHCATSTYKSTSGVKPAANETRSSFRTSIHDLGSDIWQYDFAMYWTIMMLYLVEYADWDSQKKIGYGCSNNGEIENSGLTDAMTYHTGTNAANLNTYGHTQYRHIEDLWGNVEDWCDGIRFYTVTSGSKRYNDVYIINRPADFSDTANGIRVGEKSETTGYISKWNVPTLSGFEWALLPSEVNGSNTTYVSDYYQTGNYARAFSVGSPCYQSRDNGMFYMNSYRSSSIKSSSLGSRLQKLP